MKKLTILALAAIAFVACGGNKSANNEAEADTLKSFEQEQIEASIKMHFDSIAAEFSKMEQPGFVKETKDGIALTKEEKQVKPTYLLNAAVADDATTLAEKYRVLSALNVDKRIAALMRCPLRTTTRPSPSWLPTSTILLSRLSRTLEASSRPLQLSMRL